MNKFNGVLLSLVTVGLLSACGGSDSGPNRSDAEDISDIVGTWVFSYTTDDGLTDEVYYDIRTDGAWWVYNYAGDSFNNDENCYWVTYVGNIYYIQDNHFDFDGEIVAVTKIGNDIELRAVSGTEFVRVSPIEFDVETAESMVCDFIRVGKPAGVLLPEYL